MTHCDQLFICILDFWLGMIPTISHHIDMHQPQSMHYSAISKLHRIRPSNLHAKVFAQLGSGHFTLWTILLQAVPQSQFHDLSSGVCSLCLTCFKIHPILGFFFGGVACPSSLAKQFRSQRWWWAWTNPSEKYSIGNLPPPVPPVARLTILRTVSATATQYPILPFFWGGKVTVSTIYWIYQISEILMIVYL